MKKLNSKGFGAIEALLIVVVIGMIGGVSFYVYSSQKKTNTALGNAANSQSEPQKSEKIENDVKQTTLVKKNKSTVTYASLPSGWKLTAECGDDPEASKALLPPNKESLRCKTEDFGAAIVRLVPATSFPAIKDCSGAEQKRNESKQYDYYVSYTCEAVTVGGKEGIKEVSVSNEKAAFTGGDTFVEYSFYVTPDTIFAASFTNPTNANKPEYTSTFADFVNSLKFQ